METTQDTQPSETIHSPLPVIPSDTNTTPPQKFHIPLPTWVKVLLITIVFTAVSTAIQPLLYLVLLPIVNTVTHSEELMVFYDIMFIAVLLFLCFSFILAAIIHRLYRKKIYDVLAIITYIVITMSISGIGYFLQTMSIKRTGEALTTIMNNSDNEVYITYLGTNVDSKIVDQEQHRSSVTVQHIFEARSVNGGEYELSPEPRPDKNSGPLEGAFESSLATIEQIPLHLEKNIPSRFTVQEKGTFIDYNDDKPNKTSFNILFYAFKTDSTIQDPVTKELMSRLPVRVKDLQTSAPGITVQNDVVDTKTVEYQGIPVRYDVTYSEVQ